MDGYHDPIDFSGIVGYPHNISKDVIDNVPDYNNHDDASTHSRPSHDVSMNGVIHLFMRMFLCSCLS
jgi:hypothetical protein